MTEDDLPRAARRAAAEARTSSEVTPVRARRFVTPDWDMDDAADEVSSRAETFAQEAAARLASLARSGHSATPLYNLGEPARQAAARAIDESEPATDEAPEPATSRAWKPVAIEPIPGAARAAEPATMGDKRRREAPALPTTPPPSSEERIEALVSRDRAQRRSTVAPGTRPTDDWEDAPLPAAAVPPPVTGQAPAPIEVVTGDTPERHQAFVRPEGGEGDDEGEQTRSLPRLPAAPGASLTGAAAATTAGTPEQPAQAPESLVDRLRRERTAEGQPAAAASRLGPSRRTRENGPAEPETKTTAPTTETDPASSSRLERAKPRTAGVPRWALVAGILTLVLALLLGGLLWSRGADKPASSPTPTPGTPTPSPVAVLTAADLATPADLAPAGAGWAETKTDETLSPEAPQPFCLTANRQPPTAATALQRELTSSDAKVTHRAEAFASVADATQVMTAREEQLGACSRVPAYLSHGASVSGLADRATAVTAVVQDATPVYHTVLVARTGTVVNVFDFNKTGAAITYDQAVASVAAILTRECPRSGGACPTTPQVTVGPPPPGGIAGWLTVSDLPRIKPGVGRWAPREPSTKIDVVQTRCENLQLETVAGPTARKQRTYLLQDDPQVPQNFGVDEVVLDFPSPETALAFQGQLLQNINSCPTRAPEAKLGNNGPIDGVSANGQKITGFWRTVQHPTSATDVVTFRVAVVAVGAKVVYLYGTPSSTFDFKDEAWRDVAVRAGQRVTQAS